MSQLALHGFDANLTLGNTKGVDILVSDPETKVFARVEVKTNKYRESREKLFGEGKAIDWLLVEKAETVDYDNLFYCFVSICDDDQFKFYVVPAEEVADYVKKTHKIWLRAKERGPNRIRKFRLAIEDKSKYTLYTPQASDYEDRWDIIRGKSKP